MQSPGCDDEGQCPSPALQNMALPQSFGAVHLGNGGGQSRIEHCHPPEVHVGGYGEPLQSTQSGGSAPQADEPANAPLPVPPDEAPDEPPFPVELPPAPAADEPPAAIVVEPVPSVV